MIQSKKNRDDDEIKEIDRKYSFHDTDHSQEAASKNVEKFKNDKTYSFHVTDCTSSRQTKLINAKESSSDEDFSFEEIMNNVSTNTHNRLDNTLFLIHKKFKHCLNQRIFLVMNQ